MDILRTPRILNLVDQYSGFSHYQLSQVVVALPSDFGDPVLGFRDRENDYGPDCSVGCIYFIKLRGSIGRDWGVCSHPDSPRFELLTFEHMGCKEFKSADT